MRIVVTDWAGFVGQALLRHLIGQPDHEAPLIDKLTYAENPKSPESMQGHRRHRLSQNGTRYDLSKKGT